LKRISYFTKSQHDESGSQLTLEQGLWTKLNVQFEGSRLKKRSSSLKLEKNITDVYGHGFDRLVS
jgi:hypothetical protein